MDKCEINKIFSELVNPIEEEHQQKSAEAFTPEARPIPDGLITKGLPLGHIALRGDFEDSRLEDD